MSVKQTIKVENDFSLSVYLMTLRSLHPEINSYKEESNLMYEEFGIIISESELYELENPPLQKENRYTLIYKTLGI